MSVSYVEETMLNNMSIRNASTGSDSCIKCYG